MKYIKAFENYNTQEFVKLFSHIKYFFDNLKGVYQIHVMSNVSDYSFGVTKYTFNTFKLYKMFRILPLTDKDDEYFVIYKYDENLNFYFDKNELEVITFIISTIERYKVDNIISTDKIPDIIKNINKENFEAHLDTKKYNL